MNNPELIKVAVEIKITDTYSCEVFDLETFKKLPWCSYNTEINIPQLIYSLDGFVTTLNEEGMWVENFCIQAPFDMSMLLFIGGLEPITFEQKARITWIIPPPERESLNLYHMV